VGNYNTKYINISPRRPREGTASYPPNLII